MGYETFSRDAYREARRKHDVERETDVTRRAEAQARETGQLSEIVDPAKGPTGAMRESRIRLNPEDGMFVATMGCPMDIESSGDTTGSMGVEVDNQMKILPDLYEAVKRVLPDYDPQLALGIFGDVQDRFVLCRPQFEMRADKIVEYLKEMAPQRDGGDFAEDPQYSMFARAYLTDAYTNRIGLKGYHFITTDADCHREISRRQVKRIFGEDVFETYLPQFSQKMPSLAEVVQDLQKKAHAFVLCNGSAGVVDFWEELYGPGRVIMIDDTTWLPIVIPAIIGLTEGTLEITDLEDFLGDLGEMPYANIPSAYYKENAIWLKDQLRKIDIGAQARLRHNLPHPIPKAGDIFRSKEDLWPVAGEMPEETLERPTEEITYL